MIVGSSPHTRGLRLRIVPCERQDGIIPAYAGPTPFLASPPFSSQDHPRIRGAYWVLAALKLFNVGSSPHTRGLRCMQHRQGRRTRIIPAYAGPTST